MSTGLKRFLYWSPRILCIAYALFLSLFALDVFGQGYTFGETLLALLIHLMPVYIVVIVLILAWRWDWVGAVVFTTLAAAYIADGWSEFHWSAFLAISGPLVLVGGLFLLSWVKRTELTTR